jgi:tetratricopeptide (TPR) repeat protein
MVDPQTVRAISAAIAALDYARASSIADIALSRGMRHPSFFSARALLAQQQGRYQDALTDFQQALALAPQNLALLSAIGLCLVRLDRPIDAVAAFDAAIKLNPAVPEMHFRKGWALDTSVDSAGAKLAYERAIALKPDFPEALSSLAVIDARAGRLADARAYANRSLRIDPDEPTAIIALSIIDLAEKSFASAEERLRAALAGTRAVGHTRAVLLGYLGDALDGQERVREAFAAYSEGNDEHRRLHAQFFAKRSRSIDLLNQLVSDFSEVSPEGWKRSDCEKPSPNRPHTHVFLLGFLRSGTTLLEQVLSTHPDVAALEERETFSELVPAYLSHKAGLTRLATLAGDELERARATYWSRVRSYGIEPSGRVFIDKQPLNTFNLPLIAKLFPDARILFALRDPRDVVFSCYRRHFAVNATTYELLQLEDAARYYAAVMRMAELCRERLSLNLHELRYENLVEDFDASVQAACAFIGLEWKQEMREFSAAAQERTIRSPSASQVRRRLYGEGIGHWRRYSEQLRPAFPILEPWIAKYGYAAN